MSPLPDPEHECQNCGEMRHNLLGGEGIHKCSEIVKKQELRELVERAATELRGQAQSIHWERATKNSPPVEETEAYKIADELEAVLDE